MDSNSTGECRSVWRIGHAVAVVATAVLLILTGIGTASAGPEHHGTDPAATGCNQNGHLAATRSLETELGEVVGQVQVFYSDSCHTNWIRLENNPAGGAAEKVIWSDGQPGRFTDTDYGSGSSYSKQVYAPGDTCVRFQVHLKYPDGRHYAETYIAGANHESVCGR